MEDLGTPMSPRDRTKVTIAVLVSMAVVLIVAGIGIATVRNANDTIKKAVSATSTTTVPVAQGAVPAASDLTPEQAKAVEEVKAQVAAIRGLAWKGTLPVRILTREQLGQRLRALTADDRLKHGDETATDEAVLKLLGLIAKEVDFAKSLDNLLAGGVLAYYDDEAKEIFVGGSPTGPLEPATRATLAHELTHALTDQHFDFGGRIKKLDDEGRSEEAIAFVALREGDAELVAELWSQKHLSESERRQAAAGWTAEAGAYIKAPPYLLASVLFPYQDGLRFVEGRYKAGGFAEVDNAYRKPPTSTEHILHPETYSSGQAPITPLLPDLAAATGCGKVDDGTLGEFDMSQVLVRQLSTTESRRAAAGWNGDSFTVVRCGTALGLADRWQTDDPDAARRLADALVKWGKGWSGSTRATDAEGRFSGPSGTGQVVRLGSRVDLVLADDAATADRLARALGS
jgi:hypothetical protein